LPAAVAERFEQRFKHGVGHLYGATEIGSVTYGEDGRAHDAGWVGRPMAGVSIRILDVDDPSSQPPLSPGSEGQVAVRAPSMLQRYLGDEPLPMVEGHYLTGDLGLLDEYGGLTLTGRLKALIDIGGMKVNAMEVERVLAEHASVAECVVVPARITDTLSRLTAFVIPADPANPPTANALRAHAKARLAAYKVPRAFTFVDSLPRTSLGKVQRRKLTEAEA
jgi:acyl-coenzyme A synthetase/AMP-(fatty) acid ligase